MKLTSFFRRKMSNFSPQSADQTQEEFPMKLRGKNALIPTKSESQRSESNSADRENSVLPSHSNNIRKVSWANLSPQHQNIFNSDLTDEITCQSCSNSSRNSPMSRVNCGGRMSLPVNGRYANQHYRKCNGVQANAAIPQRFPGKLNGLPSQLNKQQTSLLGNVSCCGSSLNRTFQEQGPEKPWKSKGDYFVAVLTYLLGVGNVIRFPQLCFKHGGGKEVEN